MSRGSPPANKPAPKKKKTKKYASEEERKEAQRAHLLTIQDAATEGRQRYHGRRKAFPEFAKTSLTIRTKSGALENLTLNPVQTLLNRMAEDQITETKKVRMLVLKARQPGVSTYVEGRFFWRTITGQGQRAFILTHEEPASNNLFEMAKRFYEHYPPKGKPKLAAANARELKFARRDCSYRVGTAGTEGIGRSETIQLFHGSEVAHWPNADSHAAGVLQAVPNADGTEIWLESTAAGPAGLFYTMCMRAQEGIGDYRLAFVPWFEHAEYSDRHHPRDWQPPGEWPAYAEEHKLKPSQLYWAWLKNAELANATGADPDTPCWRFRQEYPATVGDAFRTSGDDSYLRAELVEAAMEARFPDERGAPLIFGVDIAGEGTDRTHVIDRRGRRLGHTVNEPILESNQMAIAGRLARLIQLHRPDMVFVDVTGGYGSGVVDRLREQGFTMVRGINFGSASSVPAAHLNKRAEMWATLRTWLEDGADVVDDPVLRRHLTAPGTKHNSTGRLQLEPKDEIRKRLGLSPDRADAAALTFAEPVRRKAPAFMPAAQESAYDMFR